MALGLVWHGRMRQFVEVGVDGVHLFEVPGVAATCCSGHVLDEERGFFLCVVVVPVGDLGICEPVGTAPSRVIPFEVDGVKVVHCRPNDLFRVPPFIDVGVHTV